MIMQISEREVFEAIAVYLDNKGYNFSSEKMEVCDAETYQGLDSNIIIEVVLE